MPWGADNGRFSKPERYDDEKYLSWLASFTDEHRSRCLFATAPDVVGDAAATKEMSLPMLSRIRSVGVPVAFVLQDGIENDMPPWDMIDAIFIGGTTEFKLGQTAADVTAIAKSYGKWCHMGRVNSFKRMSYAKSIGCDSVDGNVLKFDPNRKVKEWVRRLNS